jgi:hypothetical protein
LGGLPEIVRKIDSNLLFNNFEELRELILTFDRSKYCPSKLKKIFNENYGPKKYVDKYLALLKLL